MVPGFHPPWIGPSMAFFFFSFFSFSPPLLFNIMQSERGKGRGLARGHTFLLTQVFFQQAGGPAGDKDGAAPWAVLAASAAPSAAVPGVGRARCPRPVLHPGTFQQRQRAAVPMPSPQHSSNLTHHSQPWKKECGICHCNCFPSFSCGQSFPPASPGRILLGYAALLRDGLKTPSANKTWLGSALHPQQPSLH